jgi:AcrR family transcriptional regulator
VEWGGARCARRGGKNKKNACFVFADALTSVKPPAGGAKHARSALTDRPTTAIARRTLRPKQHRTQEERREQTRAKLLDATIQSLLDVGYAGTTTRRVAELAGVSQGAQTHHFPHRADLVGAAVERMTEQRVGEMIARVGDLPDEPRARISVLLDHMWADFSSDLFAVFVKLWVAAADDPELHARLIPVERMLARSIAKLAAEVGGELVEREGWESRLFLVLTMLRGLALGERFEPRGRRMRDPWPMAKAALLGLYDDDRLRSAA